MEGVGARFGRSSTRYGTTTSTVFTGPVRKWHKKWVHVAPNPNNSTNTPSSNHNHKHQRDGTNGSSSHLLFYKWAPVKNGDGDTKDDVVEEPPKRKFRYIPVAVLDEQQNEAAERETEEEAEDEVKPNHAKLDATEPAPKNGVLDEKPDINDVPMEENEDAGEVRSTRQTVNLGFNLNSDEADPESDTNPDEK